MRWRPNEQRRYECVHSGFRQLKSWLLRIGPVGTNLEWVHKRSRNMRRATILGAIAALIFVLGCSGPPKTFMKTFDEPGIWKTVDISTSINSDQIWRLLVDTLSQRYDLEVLEKDSGYLRTSWKYTYIKGGKVTDRYRSRIVVKLNGSPWDQARVKCESNWLEKDKGWILGYDTRLLEDVYGDIQGKLGRVRR
jgi:hypothetical protein